MGFYNKFIIPVFCCGLLCPPCLPAVSPGPVRGARRSEVPHWRGTRDSMGLETVLRDWSKPAVTWQTRCPAATAGQASIPETCPRPWPRPGGGRWARQGRFTSCVPWTRTVSRGCLVAAPALGEERRGRTCPLSSPGQPPGPAGGGDFPGLPPATQRWLPAARCRARVTDEAHTQRNALFPVFNRSMLFHNTCENAG